MSSDFDDEFALMYDPLSSAHRLKRNHEAEREALQREKENARQEQLRQDIQRAAERKWEQDRYDKLLRSDLVEEITKQRSVSRSSILRESRYETYQWRASLPTEDGPVSVVGEMVRKDNVPMDVLRIRAWDIFKSTVSFEMAYGQPEGRIRIYRSSSQLGVVKGAFTMGDANWRKSVWRWLERNVEVDVQMVSSAKVAVEKVRAEVITTPSPQDLTVTDEEVGHYNVATPLVETLKDVTMYEDAAEQGEELVL